MDAQRKYLLVMLTRGSTAELGTSLSRTRSKVPSAFATTAGESSARTQDTSVPHLWFTSRLCHHERDRGKLLGGETLMPANNGRSADRNRRRGRGQRQEGAITSRVKKSRDKGKGKQKVSKRAARSSRAIVVIAELGDTDRATVATRTTVAEVDEEKTVEPPNHSNASSSTNRVPSSPPGFKSSGTAQATSGTTSTLMEDHARSGWLCAFVTDVNDMRLRGNEFVELLVDTGACVRPKLN